MTLYGQDRTYKATYNDYTVECLHITATTFQHNLFSFNAASYSVHDHTDGYVCTQVGHVTLEH